MGSVIILSGETDEAVISEEKAEEYRNMGTDTKAGYNYVITIFGKRVGSLGIAGETGFVKPIARISAKTIGLYISEYLKEKEKNRILQKMASLAEEISGNPQNGIDCQIFTDDLLIITGAKFVLLDLYNPDGRVVTIAALSGEPEDIWNSKRILGYQLIGSQFNHICTIISFFKRKAAGVRLSIL
ncbi:MAG: hypothetical protein GX434_04415 [Peptococcaceae bacterium]|nr:hypothetical protein [Peptococcaceae bacterium]